MKIKITLIGLLFAFVARGQAINDTTILPLNSYLTTSVLPYPVLQNLPTGHVGFLNVMDYGAKGNGVTLDDNAIRDAFNAATIAGVHGVYFPSGKTFIVSKLTTITLGSDMTVWAYGATIKMKNLTKNSWLSLQATSGSYHYNVIWLGGTINGNQYNQTWPGNTHCGYNSNFSEAHGRFLGASFVNFALFKDIQVINTVVDGIGIEASAIAVIANCHADGGAPLFYNTVGEQGTYFKITRVGLKAAYFLSDTSLNGSIGTHVSYPTNSPMDTETVSVHTNCYYKNQVQNADHIEDCYKNFYYNCTSIADTAYKYHQSFHLSNRTAICSIINSNITNGKINFNNASSLRLAIIKDCNFTSTYQGFGSPTQYFIEGRPTLVYNCSFTGRVGTNQAELKNVRKSTFTNFDALAISAVYAVDSCTFVNGYKPASLGFQGFVIHPTYVNVGYTNYPSVPPPNWELIFNSYMIIKDNSGNILGKISLY